MYITGGLGSQAHGERFTVDWDLPPDRAYAETCASVGLALWASRMSSIDMDSRYADAVERVLYNGILSGLSLEGTRYFYVNPLEVSPGIASSRQDHEHVLVKRVEWLGCSCCPPNIARTVASMAKYIYGSADDCLYVHQYASSEASVAFPGGELRIRQESGYPWDGNVRLVLEALPERAVGLAIALRIPSWCGSWSVIVHGAPVAASLERGYARLAGPGKPGDAIELSLDMAPYFVSPDSRIRDLAGRVAIQRGPLVYCIEEVDNGASLHECVADTASAPVAITDPESMGGIVRVEASGWRITGTAIEDTVPYFAMAGQKPVEAPVRLKAVPYHLWGNRAPGGEMRVWIRAALCPGDRPAASP